MAKWTCIRNTVHLYFHSIHYINVFQLQAVGYINKGTVWNAKFQIFYSKCKDAFLGMGSKLDYNRNNKHYLLNEINVR